METIFRSARLRRFALDAVPLLRTEAGVSFMVDRLNSGELGHEQTDRWFDALVYYKNPTKFMISSLSVGKSRS